MRTCARLSSCTCGCLVTPLYWSSHFLRWAFPQFGLYSTSISEVKIGSSRIFELCAWWCACCELWTTPRGCFDGAWPGSFACFVFDIDVVAFYWSFGVDWQLFRIWPALVKGYGVGVHYLEPAFPHPIIFSGRPFGGKKVLKSVIDLGRRKN